MPKQAKKKTPRARSRAPRSSAKARVLVSGSQKTPLPAQTTELNALWSKIRSFFEFLPPEVEVAFVSSKESKRLNKQFRKKNYPTDVLSFESSQESLAGSLVIDVEIAKKQAVTYKHSLRQECRELFVHGCLHLAGFDHENEAEAYMMKQYEIALNH